MKKIKLESVYVPSEDVVSRELEGEFIIIPIVWHRRFDNDFFPLMKPVGQFGVNERKDEFKENCTGATRNLMLP